MYGSGMASPPPRPRSRAALIALRVLFAVLPVVSFGLLAFAPMLRLALLKRRAADWAVLAGVLVLLIVSFVLVAESRSDNDWLINAGVPGMLLCTFGTPVYFLIMDIRYAAQASAPRGWPPLAYGPYPPPQPPYGYGPPAAPPIPGSAPSPGPAPGPVAGPAPVAPRIAQVRAELDELSELLRKEEGR